MSELIKPSHYHIITPSHYHTITLSHCHTITSSHTHTHSTFSPEPIAHEEAKVIFNEVTELEEQHCHEFSGELSQCPGGRVIIIMNYT